MKISLNWLSQYIDLSGLSVDEMSDMLTFAGIEVEDIRQQGVDSPYVVVARVAAAEQHPQADRLKVCQVDVGDGTLHQIVCGAQNYKVGDKVPCALPGAVLPGNVEIKVGKLRGVESRGMLCSASELGLPDKEHGLWILPQELEPGTPISQVVKADTLVEVEVTPTGRICFPTTAWRMNWPLSPAGGTGPFPLTTPEWRWNPPETSCGWTSRS